MKKQLSPKTDEELNALAAEALALGDATDLARILRKFAGGAETHICYVLADALEPNTKLSKTGKMLFPYRLVFRRRGGRPGRPSFGAQTRVVLTHLHDLIDMKHWKVEAAINYTAKKMGISRSTLFKIKSRWLKEPAV